MCQFFYKGCQRWRWFFFKIKFGLFLFLLFFFCFLKFQLLKTNTSAVWRMKVFVLMMMICMAAFMVDRANAVRNCMNVICIAPRCVNPCNETQIAQGYEVSCPPRNGQCCATCDCKCVNGGSGAPESVTYRTPECVICTLGIPDNCVDWVPSNCCKCGYCNDSPATI